MNWFTLVLRSLRFHARSHLGALLGATLGSAILTGALVVGDSVKESLREMALARLGNIHLALATNDRLFRTNLADALQDPLDAPVASLLQLPATASARGGAARANRVQVLGVDERFWRLAPESVPFANPSADEVVLSQSLADQLHARIGDEVLLRVAKPSALPRDAPISPQENSSVALRVTVRAIASDRALGRFGLQANQVPPFNAFVSASWLEERLNVRGRANLLLVGPSQNAVLLVADTFLRREWQLADAELELRELPENQGIELRSSRVFLDPSVTHAALRVTNDASGILTYLVNELRVGDRTTPYSMVTAMGPPIVPAGMRDDEILINQWLADDLQTKPGDELELKYFIVGRARKLEEQQARFRIRGVVPMMGPCADRTLMPDFPGVSKAENCRDWDTGFAINLEAIRPKDEKYWDDFRGAPKAFVTLAAGQRMWTNRFGNLTAVRYPPGPTTNAIESALRRTLDPASVGLSFQPVRQQALAASEQSQDFGQLFLGFSFFLILSALLLTSLLFQLGIEQRAQEIGALLALGWTAKQVRRLLFVEGGMLALLGGLAGMAGGVGYARAMLHGLSTVWREAIGNAALEYHARAVTLIIGGAASTIVALITIRLALRRQAQQPIRELLSEGFAERGWKIELRGWKRWRSLLFGSIASVGALALVTTGLLSKDNSAAGLFFGAGGLLLVAGLSFASAWLRSLVGTRSLHEPLGRDAFHRVRSDENQDGRGGTRPDQRDKIEMEGVNKCESEDSSPAPVPSLAAMGVRNTARRRKRSVATVGLLACGSFLVLAIGVFRLDETTETGRSSGTGGFALVGESTMAIVEDLNAAKGRAAFGLDNESLTDVEIVPFRVRDGDDASCLNLNRAQKPRLLGVQPELLDKRQAFAFAKVAEGMPKEHPWLLLSKRGEDGAVPAIGDQASIQWALGKKIGDTLDYVDGRGQTFKIRLVAGVANSILQGNLIIAEDEFTRRFPDESGYRMFLIDVPSKRIETVSNTLSRALQDQGLELIPTSKRLAAFNAVQNTYLSTFQVLGGLGLLLGSAGLGVVVLRNVLERRGELALLQAVGFRSRALKWLVLSEHGALLAVGVGLGIAAAAIAVWPAVMAPRGKLPLSSLGVTLAAIVGSGVLWTWLATCFALRGRLVDALRNE